MGCTVMLNESQRPLVKFKATSKCGLANCNLGITVVSVPLCEILPKSRDTIWKGTFRPHTWPLFE